MGRGVWRPRRDDGLDMRALDARTDFAQRWNVRTDVNAEFKRFKNRILLATDRLIGQCLLTNDDVASKLFYFVGATRPPTSSSGGWSLSLETDTEYLKDNDGYKLLASAKTRLSFIEALQGLFWALEECRRYVERDLLVAEVKSISNDTPGAGVAIAISRRRVLLFPAGARLLDSALVDDVLGWLDGFPQAAKQFSNALRGYLSGEVPRYRNALDDLRHALEQLLRAVLRNEKPLEKQKDALLAWLKHKEIHQRVIDMYNTLLALYAGYQNDSVKHGDKARASEVEFFVYLTGTLMRFVLQVDRGEKTQIQELSRLLKKVKSLRKETLAELGKIDVERKGSLPARQTKTASDSRRK